MTRGNQTPPMSTTQQIMDSTRQWLLQPIGGPRLRGKQHYAHSVEAGIDLTVPQYGELLGSEAEALRALFSQRRARFWGSTRAASKGHSKNKAIDTMSPGDEVLFLSEGIAFARAKVVLVFRNPALAEKIWGPDPEGKLWEYMYAVDDVEALAVPIPELTKAIGWEKKDFVQSLIGRSGEEALAIDALLRGERRPILPAPRPVEPGLTRDTLLRTIRSLTTDPAHQSLALLWSIGRLVEERPRLAPWSELEEEVGSLLEDFGGEGGSATAEHSLRHLRSGGLWEVLGVTGPDLELSAANLRRARARAGLKEDAANVLKNSRSRAQAVALVLSTHFSGTDTDRTALLQRTGLDGFLSAGGRSEDPSGPAPVGRRPRSGSQPDRDRQSAALVKDVYGSICQVCSEPLETRGGPYSEAAHIQGLGSPHFGPDVLENLLCLCPNHHKQFDTFSIYIDENWAVCMTGSGEAKWELTRRHRIDTEYVAYHRDLCLLVADRPATPHRA
ncbi:HNH endonuclease [Streptomyces tsukubensis]|uniref:HNH endonuclease n=1 Tax=Streptomyces tsukubensis TaxID=83656 RepID=UPI00344C6223